MRINTKLHQLGGSVLRTACFFRSNNYRSSKQVDSNGRPVKGRGFMVRIFSSFLFFANFRLSSQRYTGKSRSRSRTPPHWRSAVEKRQRYPESNDARGSNIGENRESKQTEPKSNDQRTRRDEEENHRDRSKDDRHGGRDAHRRSDRHERRREDADDHRSQRTEPSSRHKHHRDSASPAHRRSSNSKQREKEASKHSLTDSVLTNIAQNNASPPPARRRRHSKSPPATSDRARSPSPRRHRRSRTPPKASVRARSPSPAADDRSNNARSHHRQHSRTSPTGSPPPAEDRHPTKETRTRQPPPEASPPRRHRHSRTPPPSATRVRAPSPSPPSPPAPPAPEVHDSQSRRHRRSRTPSPSPAKAQPLAREASPVKNPPEEVPRAAEPVVVDPPAPTRTASAKRRKRWENEEEFNERQTMAQEAQHKSLEDELRMIAQTSASQLDAPTPFIDIPPPPPAPLSAFAMPAVTVVPSRSKWDDEEEL